MEGKSEELDALESAGADSAELDLNAAAAADVSAAEEPFEAIPETPPPPRPAPKRVTIVRTPAGRRVIEDTLMPRAPEDAPNPAVPAAGPSTQFVAERADAPLFVARRAADGAEPVERPDSRPAVRPAVNHSAAAARSPNADSAKPSPAAELLRIEQTLADIRSLLEPLAREQRYPQFSAARYAGAALQVIAGLFAFAAVFAWFTSPTIGEPLVKVAFAAFFQLAALTAFVVARK